MSATITSSQGTTVTTTYAWTGAAGLSASTRTRDGVLTRNESLNPFATSVAWQSNNSTLTPTTRVTLPTTPPGLASITTGTMGQNTAGAGALLSLYNADGMGAASSLPLRAMSVWVMVNAAGYQARVGTVGTFTPLAAYIWTFVRAETAQTGPNASSINISRVDSASPAATDRGYATASTVALGDTAPVSYFDGNSPASSETNGDTTAPTLILGYETARRSQNLYHDVLGGGQDVTLRPAALRSGTLRLFYPSEADAAAAMTMHAKSALFYVYDPDRPSIGMYYAVDGTLALELDSGRNVWTLAVGYQEVNP